MPFALFLATLGLVYSRRTKNDPWSYLSRRTLIGGIWAVIAAVILLPAALPATGADDLVVAAIPFGVFLIGLFFFLTALAQGGRRENERLD